MEILVTALISLCIVALLNALLSNKSGKKLPPGPANFPVIGNIRWAWGNGRNEDYVQKLVAKYGSIFSIRVGRELAFFISDHRLAYEALVKNGVSVSDRPRGVMISPVHAVEAPTIGMSRYGPAWKLFRKNLSSEIMHPARIQSFTHARHWALENLVERLRRQALDGGTVAVMDEIRYTFFSLLVFMCFGERLGEDTVRDIDRVSDAILSRTRQFTVLNYFPWLSYVVFIRKWRQLFRLAENQGKVLRPLVSARRNQLEERRKNGGDGDVDEKEPRIVAYLDTLVDLEMPDKNRKVNESELVALCSEFMDVGTDTTTTTMEWIMANLVKFPKIQAKVYEELSGLGKSPGETIKEEDLPKLVYLKAVILEGLRRHPPGYYLIPHKLTDDVELDGYVLPKDSTINVLVMAINRDPTLWEDPMEFKPERFLKQGAGEKPELVDFDVRGSGGDVKIISFGVGRRICPGINLAMMHLGYFIANMVWNFEWVPTEEGVDLTEFYGFTVLMKNPLKARLVPRPSSSSSSAMAN